MKFTTFAAATLATLASALPSPQSSYSGACLTQSDADKLVAEYAAVQAHASSDLGGPWKTARAIIAPGFQETSDSLNELIGIPVSFASSCF